MLRYLLGFASALLSAFTVAGGALLSTTPSSTPKVNPVGTTITLDYATFTGLQNDSSGVIYFRGIRYADPPIGNLRWKAPVSPPSTQLGNVNATKYGNACIATKQSGVSSGYSEDCLFGNVYIPKSTQVGDNLPVMVWLHGGGYEGGSTHDAPPDLIINSSTKPLIFVSFEYRLGQFGFLGGSEIKAGGALNAGLLDQRAALRWVQKYIHLFGGDKSHVTIWGQSAGSGSIMFHLIANGGNNEGLFRAAIGDSPPLSFTPAFDDVYDEQIYQQFATLAGCSSSNTSTSLQCLRSATSADLALAGSKLIASRTSTLYPFAPIVDGSFITRRPVEAYTSPSMPFGGVPMLLGSNTNEGSKWSATLPDGSANTSMPNATELTVSNFLRGQYSTLTQDAVDAAVKLYPLAQYNGSLSLQAQQMYGEARYICTAAMMGSAMKKAGVENVYQYHYDNPHLGSNHKSELDAFFSPPGDANADDLLLFKAMREYWTSFVTSERPVSTEGAFWESILSGDDAGSARMFLHPGGIEMKKEDQALSSRCAYWRSISDQMET